MRHRQDELPYEVVDLASDSEDGEALTGDEFEFLDALSERPAGAEDWPEVDDLFDDFNPHLGPNQRPLGDGVIDLTNIPDVDVPPSDPVHGEIGPSSKPARPVLGKTDDLVTEAEALQLVLDVLPDISIDHVLKLIKDKTTDSTRTVARCENIVTELLDGTTYPKEADDAKNKKRKRNDEDGWEDFEKAERDPEAVNYENDACDLLKDEFLRIPVRHIANVLKEQKTFFKAFITLEEQTRNYGRIANSNLFSRISKARIRRGIELILIERGSQLPKELHAARQKVESEMAKRHKAEEAQLAETLNLKRAQENNAMGECACCFADVPLNRMISCSGKTSHLYCLECPKRQVETLIGQSKCRPKCFGVDDCEGTFTRKQLQQVLSSQTFDRLEHMQQQEDLAAAGLDFLSECPFCDFKMECLPINVDKEFRCQSTKCGKTSCRLCNKETHIPLSCKEAAKEGQLTLRHIVEEAMSAALIRQCNQCKHPFVKEYGCNKMTCSHCRNVQCYICSKNVRNYDHFGDVARGRCPLHENVEDRHEQEVKKAADEAMAKVRADNPGLSDADLMIKVSDRVKQAEDARRGQAQARDAAFPYHMVDDQLVQRGQAARGLFMDLPPQAVMPVHHRPANVLPPPAQYVPYQPPAIAAAPFVIQPIEQMYHFQYFHPNRLLQPHQPHLAFHFGHPPVYNQQAPPYQGQHAPLPAPQQPQQRAHYGRPYHYPPPAFQYQHYPPHPPNRNL